MRTLDEILYLATKERWAVPHFNFTTLEQLKVIIETCERLGSPVMVGTSEGESDFFGLAQAVALVRLWQKEDVEVYLNADHTRSVERAKSAVGAGYDSIHIDLSKEPLEQNIAGTQEIVAYARAAGRPISVEGEVGYLPTDSSRIYKEAITPDPALFTKPEEAARFVTETGVNRFAPAVGNIHGIAANVPNLDFELVKTIRRQIPQGVALTLHGGSGIGEANMSRAVAEGFANVHISTELRGAWKEGLAGALAANPEEYAPYKLLRPAVERMKKVIEEKIKIFKSAGRSQQRR